MDGFNISKILLGLQNQELYLKKLKDVDKSKAQSFAPEINTALSNTKPQTNQLLQSLQGLNGTTQLLQMNHLAGLDRSVFIKNLLGLPQNIGEVLQSLQNPNKPLLGGTLGLNNINQDLLKNKTALESLFNEAALIQTQQTSQKPQSDITALFFSGMVSLGDISKLILQNGKQAVAALILAMASASKQGVSNEQIQETLSILNSCIALAESNNPTQSLKSLMMLYIPWLPLNEGVGFDLEVTPQGGETDSNDSKLTVLIQTINYGNLKGTFTLTTSNSVDILIICSDKFPKNTLYKMLLEESSSHAMNTNIDIEEVKPIVDEINETKETKVNLSATNEMNPYLLLMAHSFIRNAILIDNNAILNP